jgi:TRAP-type C4-dicarboxylate transport system permease large subunit
MDELCLCCDITWYFMGGMFIGMLMCGFTALVYWSTQWERNYREEQRAKREKEEIMPLRKRY